VGLLVPTEPDAKPIFVAADDDSMQGSDADRGSGNEIDSDARAKYCPLHAYKHSD
jgi:hypothetical protein